MSWDVSLVDPATDEVVEVERHMEGGTYAIGGIERAELNVTYNYGPRFREAWDGVGFREMLNGKEAATVVEALDRAVEKLGTDRDPDYWEPTEGNAGRALALLSKWAHQHPTAMFEVW